LRQLSNDDIKAVVLLQSESGQDNGGIEDSESGTESSESEGLNGATIVFCLIAVAVTPLVICLAAIKYEMKQREK